MLTIRLFRIGRRNQPSFKIIVTDKRKSSTRGRFVEEVGVYNPLTKQRNIKRDRVKYWISVGAKPSATVHNMLVADKVIEGKKIAKHKPSAAAAVTPPVAPEPAQEAPTKPIATESTPTPAPPADEPETPPDAPKQA